MSNSQTALTNCLDLLTMAQLTIEISIKMAKSQFPGEARDLLEAASKLTRFTAEYLDKSRNDPSFWEKP